MITRTLTLIALFVTFTSPLAAQDVTARAKELYASASYEEALAVLDEARPVEKVSLEAQQYRAFCLLALQRADAAKETIEAIYAAEPMFHLDEAQASPRVQTIFRDLRRSALPGITQRAYAAAKAAFDKKDPKAAAQFERVLTLLDDPDMEGQIVPDFRTVVAAFRDLSRATAAAAVLAPPSPPSPSAAPTRPAASRPAPAAPPAVVIPAVAITRPMPQWSPMNSTDARETFSGQIELSIDAQGNVTSASIVTSIYPSYDQQLIAYARRWKFAPATRNGTPIASIRVVPIRLQQQP